MDIYHSPSLKLPALQKQKNKFNILVVGVDTQGMLLASNLLVEVGVEAGYGVKKAEVHVMLQRGGIVSSHVGWGGSPQTINIIALVTAW